MCIGVSILLFPPTVLGAGGYMWYQGKQTIVSMHGLQPPQHGAISRAFGVLTLASVYGVQELSLAKINNANGSSVSSSKSSDMSRGTTAQTDSKLSSRKYIPPHKAVHPFQPPQTADQLLRMVGRPMMLRVTAVAISCFTAGMVQSQVAFALTAFGT